MMVLYHVSIMSHLTASRRVACGVVWFARVGAKGALFKTYLKTLA
jgi:hypothetical protein